MGSGDEATLTGLVACTAVRMVVREAPRLKSHDSAFVLVR
jgi:hypothetical protein